MNDDNNLINPETVNYDEGNIQTLTGLEHIRLRPGMYIGRLGDGSSAEDGIYVLLKEVFDNSIDEFKMKAGDRIEVNVEDNLRISVRDYGRGIPQGKLIESVSILNTSGKFDSKAFKKSIGLNGVGVKAVNALSSHFEVHSYRDGKVRKAVFECGKLLSDVTEPSQDENGTYIYFEPDATKFVNYQFHDEIVENMLRNYTYLNIGLTIMYNGRRILSRHGLEDLLKDRMTSDALYPIVHLQGDDIEIAFTHANQYGEEYYSFVNGQHTTQGGTHQSAFKEHIARTIKEFYGKYEYGDIRTGIVAAIAINVEEPMFESQTKIKLGSLTMAPDGGVSINKYIGDFIKQEVDNYLHIHQDVAEVLENKIKESERDRKAMAGVTKLARERAKKANLHNRKLRDCRIHFSDVKNDRKEESCIFITEGDSASGSITKSRDVNTQAVFSLRGKPLNCFGLTKKVVYENEEFNLLQAALDIEDGLDTLRYNKVIVATDADVDGMHIPSSPSSCSSSPSSLRKVMYMFFRRRFSVCAIVVLRSRTRKQSLRLMPSPIKRAISSPVIAIATKSARRPSKSLVPILRLPDSKVLEKTDQVQKLLEYYMGKNTMERQNFIIDNLVVEEDRPEEEF